MRMNGLMDSGMVRMEILLTLLRDHGNLMALDGGLRIQQDGTQYRSGIRLMAAGITSMQMDIWHQVSGEMATI